jgi:hypothetical protein
MMPAIIVVGHLAVGVADRPPVVNFEQTCREETTAGTNGKFEVCVADEKHARDQLTAQWSSFDPTARARCAREATSGQTASYLELLVCLELDQADREVHGQSSTLGLPMTEPGRPGRGRDEAIDPTQSRPTQTRPAAAIAPSRPASNPGSVQQPVARPAVPPPVAPAATLPSAAPLPISPPPPESAPQPASPPPQISEPEPVSQAELLRQSFCRSPLGYVLPGCP